MNRFTWVLGLAIAQAITTPLFASEQAAVASVSPLADAVALAWARAPATHALPHRQAQADAQARLAAGWTPGPPAIALSTLGDRLQARNGRQEWEAEVATPLWQRGERDAHRALAQARQSHNSAKAAALRLELAGQVRERWWALVAARGALLAALQRLESAQALQTDVERRWRAGDLARTDANTAHAETLAARADWLDAQREERQMQQAWRSLTGVAAPAALGNETEAPDPPPPQDHPASVLAREAVQVAQAHLRVADRSRSEAPELALRWVRERGDGAEPYANTVGLQLRIPLSSGPKIQAELAGARAELAELESEQQLQREQRLRETDQARSELESATLKLASSETRAALTADTLQLLQKSFQLGETDLPSLMRARLAAFSAAADAARQRAARAAAVSQLNQSLGLLP